MQGLGTKTTEPTSIIGRTSLPTTGNRVGEGAGSLSYVPRDSRVAGRDGFIAVLATPPRHR